MRSCSVNIGNFQTFETVETVELVQLKFIIEQLKSICGELQKSAEFREFLAQATCLCDLFASGAICQEAFEFAT